MTEKHMLAVGTNDYNNIIRLVDFLEDRGLLQKPKVNLNEVGSFTITMNGSGIFMISRRGEGKGENE